MTNQIRQENGISILIKSTFMDYYVIFMFFKQHNYYKRKYFIIKWLPKGSCIVISK